MEVKRDVFPVLRTGIKGCSDVPHTLELKLTSVSHPCCHMLTAHPHADALITPGVTQESVADLTSDENCSWFST